MLSYEESLFFAMNLLNLERIILYSKEDYPLRHIGLSSFEYQMNLFLDIPQTLTFGRDFEKDNGYGKSGDIGSECV